MISDRFDICVIQMDDEEVMYIDCASNQDDNNYDRKSYDQ